MNTIAFHDTELADREYFERTSDAHRLHYQFHEFRLPNETAASVEGARAVRVKEGLFCEDHSGEILQDDKLSRLLTLVEQTGVARRITHLSTGDGASLEFLEGKKLPGVAVLQHRD